MIVEVYESKTDKSITVICKGDTSLLEDDAVLIRTIEGRDWDDCMVQHHAAMYWEPYIPCENVIHTCGDRKIIVDENFKIY